MPSFEAEQALAAGEIDPFEFGLALKLGRSVAELKATVSAGELIRWRAFFNWLGVQLEHERKVAVMRATNYQRQG